MIKIKTTLILALLVLSIACAQEPAQRLKTVKGEKGARLTFAWTKTHTRASGRPSGFKSRLAVDSKGNVYLLDELGGPRRRGLWLRKYRPNGETAWTVAQPPSRSNQLLPQDMVVDTKDNVYVAATARGAEKQTVVQKFAPNGRRLWRKFQPGDSGKNVRLFFSVSPRGGIYVAGTRETSGTPRPWAANYSRTGGIIWERNMATPGVAGGLAFYNNQLLIADLGVAKDSPAYRGGRVITLDPAGVPRPYFLPAEADDFPFSFKMDALSILSYIEHPQGKAGNYYDFDETGALSVWLGAYGNAGEIRAALGHAPEQPGTQFALGEHLKTDKKGNVYAAILLSGDPHPVTKLFKIKASLPGARALNRQNRLK